MACWERLPGRGREKEEDRGSLLRRASREHAALAGVSSRSAQYEDKPEGRCVQSATGDFSEGPVRWEPRPGMGEMELKAATCTPPPPHSLTQQHLI